MKPLNKATTFLALALLLSSILVFLPQNASASTATETFDNYTDGFYPCTPNAFAAPCTGNVGPLTTDGSGGLQVQSAVKDGASGKALQFTSSSGIIVDYNTGSDLCSNGGSFAIASSTTTLSGGPIVFVTSFRTNNVGDSTHSGFIYKMSFLAASVLIQQQRYNHATVTSTATQTLVFSSGGAVAANTFYHFQWGCPTGSSSGSFSLYSPEAAALGNPPAVLSTNDCSSCADFSPAYHLVLGAGAASSTYFDNLGFSPNTSVPTVGAAATTVNTMSLTGFDVDPMDRVVIARASSGGASQVLAFDSNTLQVQGVSPLANGCNKLDGVMAYSQDPPGTGYTGFLDCTVSSGSANFLKIRNVLLGDPDQSDTVCSDFCSFDLQTESGGAVCPGTTSNSLPGGAGMIGNIVAAPISWRAGYNADGGAYTPPHATGDSALIAFAFSDSGNGNVGIWAINQINNVNPNESCGVSVAFGGSAITRQICSWRGDDGKDYMTAVGDTTSGISWRTDISLIPGVGGIGHSAGQAKQPSVAITQVYPHQAPYDKAMGVACAGAYNFILTPGGVVAKVKVLGTGLGPIWHTTGAAATARGITVSRDGLRVAYTSDATHATIANATTGLVLGTVTMPTGTFKQMFLDDAANNLYIATSTKISRYDLAGASAGINSGPPNGVRGMGAQQCTVDSAGVCGPAGGTSTSTAGATGSFLGLQPAAFDVSGSGSATSGGMLMSLLLIVGMAAACAGLIPGDSPQTKLWGAGIGALLGFGWTVFMGYMPQLIVFLIVIVGVVILGFRFRSGMGSESG